LLKRSLLGERRETQLSLKKRSLIILFGVAIASVTAGVATAEGHLVTLDVPKAVQVSNEGCSAECVRVDFTVSTLGLWSFGRFEQAAVERL
jgi:hypothetical protein